MPACLNANLTELMQTLETSPIFGAKALSDECDIDQSRAGISAARNQNPRERKARGDLVTS
jgi:hypothetical protein